jgi:uncharacterized surface protein with fasciclin (FAS1) repeats
MKKILVVIGMIAAASAGTAAAHCGHCGVGDAPAKASSTQGDIVAVASSAGDFDTLVTAVQTAGLVETLQSDGPFTVFAPTDKAFSKLPQGTLENLLANPDELKQILLYHVVPGTVMASDVVNLSSATTAAGSDVSIEVIDGKVMVDNAQVVKTDVMASNGVIHVIDTVIVPGS